MDTPAVLRTVSEKLRAADVVGLDGETDNAGTLCLLQIATRQRTFLIDPLTIRDLKPIFDVLSGTTPLKVVHNARFTPRVLAAIGILLDSVFDTLDASRRTHGHDILGGHSLATVCERELGISLDKAEQSSNWSRRPLDAVQLNYAAVDAEVLLALHERFKHFGRNG